MMMQTDTSFLYEFILRRAAEGILHIAADGKCAKLNPAGAAMLRVTASDIIGKTVPEAFPNNPLLIRLLRQGQPSPMTLDIPLPRDRIAQGTAEDLPDGTRAAILHDVTELRDLESRRAELIRTIAHDLRNPINAMSGYADLVLKFGEVNERQSRFVTRIRQTSNKLIEVSSSLLNLAWFEAGMPMAYLPFDMASLVREVVREKSPKAKDRSIRLVISIQDAMPTIMGHPNAIKEAIAHLLDNAIQYSDSYSNIVIHAWQQGSMVMCSVADRGMGIAPEEMDLIWDRMWRSPRVQEIPGGGIGLTYARMVIERHGGRIWAESTLGKGSTFTFLLPFVEI